MYYILVVQKDKNRFLAHGSITKTWLLKNQDLFLNKPNLSRYPHIFKECGGTLEKTSKYIPLIFIVVEKYKDGKFDVPFISNSRPECKTYVRAKKSNMNKEDRDNYRYSIIYLTANNFDEKDEEERWLNHTDSEGRIRCYYTQRSSGEYDIKSTLPDEKGSYSLGYVDNYKELEEFFEDEYIKDRYFCLSI